MLKYSIARLLHTASLPSLRFTSRSFSSSLRWSTSPAAAATMFDSSARLAALRAEMQAHNLNAYIVDSGDAHSNEYTAECDDRRAWISGFTGSAGTAIVLAGSNDAAEPSKAFLWTDGRYHQVRPREQRTACRRSKGAALGPVLRADDPSSLALVQQAAQQINEQWTLMKHGVPDVPAWTEWLTKPSHSSTLLPSGSRIGLDPSLITVADYTKLAPALETAKVELVPIRENLIDLAWDKVEPGTRPARPKNEVLRLEDKFAGESAVKKLERVRDEMQKKEVFGGDKKAEVVGGAAEKRCWGTVLTQLDEIACTCPRLSLSNSLFQTDRSLCADARDSLAQFLPPEPIRRGSEPARFRHPLQPRFLLVARPPDRFGLQADLVHRP